MVGTFQRFTCFLVLLCNATFALDFTLTPNKPTAIYEAGEAIEWKVELKDAPTPLPEVKFTLKKGGLTVMKEGTLDFSKGPATIQTSLDEPGTILAEVKAKVDGKDVKALAGAAITPAQIKLSAPRPDDFDAFWKEKIAQLNAIPPNEKIEPGDSGKANVEYFKVTLDNIKESHIYGQLAKPKSDDKNAKFPAMLLVQYAGVYGLPKTNVTNRAAQGWLAFNIMAHDLPLDQPPEFYKDAEKGKVKDYLSMGDESRETSYFLRMYLSCYRAAEYLANRPEWDGKTLVVTGGSQGGQQSLITAGLHPKITALVANVPAGCDTTGPWIGRASGYPYWAQHAKWRGKPDADKAVMETSRYFDCVNFAANIKCPALVGLGLIDETCPPAGVFAAMNQAKGPKEIVVMVNSAHQDKNGSQKQFYARSEAWLKALQAGQAAPVK